MEMRRALGAPSPCANKEWFGKNRSARLCQERQIKDKDKITIWERIVGGERASVFRRYDGFNRALSPLLTGFRAILGTQRFCRSGGDQTKVYESIIPLPHFVETSENWRWRKELPLFWQ